MIRYYSIEYNSGEKPQKLVTKDPTIIPKLLCAARTQDEDTIRSILKSILQDGVAEEDINTFDCSGRVSSFLDNIDLSTSLYNPRSNDENLMCSVFVVVVAVHLLCNLHPIIKYLFPLHLKFTLKQIEN